MMNTNYRMNTYNGNIKTQKPTKPGEARRVSDQEKQKEDMTLEEYKAYFNEKMDALYTHPSQKNMNDVIEITDAAYKRMQTDTEYEEKILDCFAKNKEVNFGGYIPVISYMYIGGTWESCYGYTKGMKENVGYIKGASPSKANKNKNKKIEQERIKKKQEEEQLEKKRMIKEFYDKIALKESLAHKHMIKEG